jgi:hypothetical protein
MKDIYELDELIDKLEQIQLNSSGNLNFPKALYTLCMEIKKIKEKLKIDK